jgi:hypothetical protein
MIRAGATRIGTSSGVALAEALRAGSDSTVLNPQLLNPNSSFVVSVFPGVLYSRHRKEVRPCMQ